VNIWFPTKKGAQLLLNIPYLFGATEMKRFHVPLNVQGNLSCVNRWIKRPKTVSTAALGSCVYPLHIADNVSHIFHFLTKELPTSLVLEGGPGGKKEGFMGRQKSKSNHHSKKKKKSGLSSTKNIIVPTPRPNFVKEAGPGCYIARRDRSPSWLIGWEDIEPEDFQGEEVPDIAIDPDEQTLSLCNVESVTKVAYITVFEVSLRGAHGEVLPLGQSTNNNGETTNCATFIILCPPRVFVHICFLDVTGDQDISEIRIDSDVQPWTEHPNPNDEHFQRLTFPLQGGPYLCTQGENGELTHFFSGNLHAIDFRCPIGTPLLAVGDGIVVEAKDVNTLSGIEVMNLFEWNSILIRLDEEEKRSDHEINGPLFVEYVHIRKAHVKAGDRVQRGQIIGESGSVGFSPEPHLHFSAFRSLEPTAPTVRVRFETSAEEGESLERIEFLPEAGKWYDSSGLAGCPPSSSSDGKEK